MVTIPPRIHELAEARLQARTEKDFARADALRDELDELGWRVLDTADGYELTPAPTFERVAPDAVPSAIDEPARFRISLHLLHEGFLEDLARFLDALRAHHDLSEIETVVVDPGSAHADEVASLVASVPNARALHLDRDPGWAAARNAGIRTALADVVILADLSIEPTGDILTPLADAFEADPELAVTGPIGIVTTDMREWQEAATPVCDAIEGYLFATRRDLLRRIELIDERFTWYRNADIHLSLRLREEAGGAPARITPVAFARHDHRGYSRYPEGKVRNRESRRNYNRVLDRYRNRRDLLSGAPANE